MLFYNLQEKAQETEVFVEAFETAFKKVALKKQSIERLEKYLKNAVTVKQEGVRAQANYVRYQLARNLSSEELGKCDQLIKFLIESRDQAGFCWDSVLKFLACEIAELKG